MKGIIRIVVITIAIFALLGLTYYIYKIISPKSVSKDTKIVVVIKDFQHISEFWKVVRAGVDTAAKEFDVSVEFVGSDSEINVAGQINILDDYIKTKPAAIVMAASDYKALVPAAEKIKKAGIKLVTIDSGLDSDVTDSFIATDNLEAGKKAGIEMASIITAKSKVAIISYVKGSATAIERESGVKTGFGEPVLNRLVGTYFCDDYQTKAYAITRDILKEHTDIAGIACLNENSTVGAAKAIEDLGLNGKVMLVGFDSSIDEIKFIEKGIIQATVVQKPFNMGYLGIKTAVQALRGEKVEKRINTGSELVTKEKMYTSENQKLLFPFIEE